MKIKRIFIVAIIISFTLTGCWDQQELDFVFIVSGVGIDKLEDGQIKLTLLSTYPKANKSSGSNLSSSPLDEFILISEKGEGMVDICSKISKKLSRKLVFSQLEGIIIGEEMAKNGLEEVLDFFPRMPEIPMKAFITFSKGKAIDALSLKSYLEYNSVKKIDKLRDLNTATKMYIKDFIYMINESGIQPCICVVGEYDIIGDSCENNEKTVGVIGGAVFNEDKLIKFIGIKELKGIMIVKNKLRQNYICVNADKLKKSGKVSGEITKVKTRVTPTIDNGEISIEIDVFMEANIIDSSAGLDFSEVKNIHYIENLYSKDIENLVNDTIKYVKHNCGVDVFGFGTIIHGKYPKQWHSLYKDNWDELWKTININVNSKVKIKGTGFDNKSIMEKSN
ncbi:Ger(x)C family spore germination protein [Clostridium sp. UBA1652]|uniref:Ger(x)C family spore germination protein n=1 Tax=Clostridium sp. UBA1652 TaxID=1946348 RepID=UPI00257998C8|nr:Ger(x)C family spore germination protein [Clostridium sp. UBA1652]